MSDKENKAINLEEDIQARRDDIRKYFASVGKSEFVDELCHCGEMRSEHADDNNLVRGHGKCLRCECEQFSWKSFVYAPNMPRIAFFVLPTRVDSNGEYIALIAVEGEKGFYQTDWHWGKDLKLAEECAEERNARLGLTKKEAALIQASTMRKR